MTRKLGSPRLPFFPAPGQTGAVFVAPGSPAIGTNPKIGFSVDGNLSVVNGAGTMARFDRTTGALLGTAPLAVGSALVVPADALFDAAGLLFPIEWPEPFGLVMAEAMACGTPVLATRWGSVPEVVADGETGFICDTPDELVSATQRLGEIDRRACRHHAETCFSTAAMADGYERVYAALAGIGPQDAAPPEEEAA